MHARRLPHGLRLRALVALLVAFALVIAGCGEDTPSTPSGGGPDPATVAAVDAFLYGEVVVRPSGDLEEDVRAALRKALLVEDPGAEIRRLVDRAMTEGGDDTSYARDLEPWLGERAAGFVRLAGSDEPDYALAFEIRDRGALEDTIERFRDQREQRIAGTYRGVEYDRETDDPTFHSAIVGDFYVGGNVTGLRAAVDAWRGDSLDDAARFDGAVSALDEGALAWLYLDPQVLARQVRASDDVDPQVRDALGSPKLAHAAPVTATLTADADEIAIEATGDTALLGKPDDGGDVSVSIDDLPGDAWLALATPPLGPLVRQALDGAGVHDEAAAQLRQGAGLDLDRDLLDQLGGLGLFVRGSSVLDIGGGVLLRTTSDDGARRLLTMIQSVVATTGAGEVSPVEAGGGRGFQLATPQTPQPIVVLAKGAAIAAGYAASSAQDLLDPQQTLADNDEAQAAIDTLGDGFEPSFVLLVPPLARLLRSLDQLQVAELSEVVRYVSAYESLAAGTEHDGDRTTVRVVAALR